MCLNDIKDSKEGNESAKVANGNVDCVFRYWGYDSSRVCVGITDWQILQKDDQKIDDSISLALDSKKSSFPYDNVSAHSLIVFSGNPAFSPTRFIAQASVLLFFFLH